MLLSFFVVAGLKAVFARPASLTANWLIAAELAAIEPRRIPFTCATVSTGSLKKWWPAYLFAFVSYTFGLSALERHALRTPKATRAGAVAFEEQPDVTQELGLGPHAGRPVRDLCRPGGRPVGGHARGPVVTLPHAIR